MAGQSGDRSFGRARPTTKGTDAEKNRAFRIAFQALETRIKLFASLRLEALDRLAIEREVDEIGWVVTSSAPSSVRDGVTTGRADPPLVHEAFTELVRFS